MVLVVQALLFASLVGNLLHRGSSPRVCHSDTKNYLAEVQNMIVVLALVVQLPEAAADLVLCKPAVVVAEQL